MEYIRTDVDNLKGTAKKTAVQRNESQCVVLFVVCNCSVYISRCLQLKF